MLVFTGLSTVGGALNVLPLSIWPWVPDLSLSHYATHAVSAAAEIPLIILLLPGR